MVEEIINIFKKYNIYNSAVVASTYTEFLYIIKLRAPKIITALIVDEPENLYNNLVTSQFSKKFVIQKFSELFDKIYFFCVETWIPSFLGTEVLFIERSMISEQFIKKQRSKNRIICAWTVNEKSEILWMNKILKIPTITDKPSLISVLNNFYI